MTQALDMVMVKEMLKDFAEGFGEDTSTTALALLNRGVASQSIWDALFDGAGELLMRAPGIASLHATTFSNACHYSFQRCRDEQTRKMLLLQNAAFMPLFRGNSKDKGNGWHIGMSSEVRFAAAIPAKRATSKGSPLGFLGKALRTLGAILTKADASAVRLLADLPETSTIAARPDLS